MAKDIFQFAQMIVNFTTDFREVIKKYDKIKICSYEEVNQYFKHTKS
jgi:hypothetical protein